VTINEHMTHFAGRPIQPYNPDAPWNPHRVAYRIDAFGGDDAPGWATLERGLEALADREGPGLRALVIGRFENFFRGMERPAESSRSPAELLCEMRHRFPELEAIFLGDITAEEYEISWIQQGDITPLFEAYPKLAHLGVRGGDHNSDGRGLRLEPFRAGHLKTLIFESGGLPMPISSAVIASELPSLRHLELWLGTEGYGGGGAPDPSSLIREYRFPRLRHLGLRNSEDADWIAEMLGEAEELERLSVLDLSLGNLSDEGAEHLLKNPRLASLDALILYHHYLSPGMEQRLQEEIVGPLIVTQYGINIRRDNLGFRDERYCAVTE
jgi:hypothetical protein